MAQKPVSVNHTVLQPNNSQVSGEFTPRNGQLHYCIRHYDNMRPFLMSIVSPSDHWMFISSNGALTAGRRNAGFALFPYYTDDKIQDSPDHTGSKTILLVEAEDSRCLWEPFSDRHKGCYRIQRNLYKSIYGNSLTFEEQNIDLGLTFSYTWSSSEKHGWVKQSRLTNHTEKSIEITLLDGLQNLLPAGVKPHMQTALSTLVDAYKKSDFSTLVCTSKARHVSMLPQLTVEEYFIK